MRKNCILCGVGGQGTVLAAKVLADAAMAAGEEVKTTETIGMAQRGGCVVSHVRIGQEIHSPLIPEKTADLMIAFEPAEAVRNLGYMKEEGTVIMAMKAVKPVTASLTGSSYDGTEMAEYLKGKVKQLIQVDTEEICKACGSAKVVNVALLGAAAETGILGISKEQLEASLFERLPLKVHELNRKALKLGSESAK